MNTYLRSVFVIISCLTFGMAISFYLLAGYGPDPFTVLTQCVSRNITISVGMANWLLSLVIVLAVLVIDRKLIGLATLFTLAIIGPSIDLFIHLFHPIVTPGSPAVIRLIFLIAALLFLSFSVALYLAMDLGISVVDMTPVLASKLTGIQYRWCKVTFDVLVIIICFFLGGTSGSGTVLAALGTGPLTHILRPRIEKLLL